jgi:succinate dehydrogenase/fumarate reductase cytochrome b subunit
MKNGISYLFWKFGQYIPALHLLSKTSFITYKAVFTLSVLNLILLTHYQRRVNKQHRYERQ